MKVEVSIVNAFTQNHQGGNPAAIVLSGERFSTLQKQQLAKQLSMSETTFISKSDVADFKMEFFTPIRQIAHCGHATIAAFSYLKHLALVKNTFSSKETIDGVRHIKFGADQVYMEQQAPVFTHPEDEDLQVIKQSLGLQLSSHQPVLVYTGNRFLVQEVDDIDELKRLQPDQQAIKIISEKYDLIGYYVFARLSEGNLDATARMFAPAYGIPEESATGMAAGPLASYLYQLGLKKNSFNIEQGRFMATPSPSLINVKMQIENKQIISLYAGGRATFMGKKIINLA